MSQIAELRDSLERFLKGDIAFPELTATIGEQLHAAPEAASTYRTHLDQLVNEGRLSLHLYGVLRQVRAEPASATTAEHGAARRSDGLAELLGRAGAAPDGDDAGPDGPARGRREPPIALVARPSERLLDEAPAPGPPPHRHRSPPDRPADPSLRALLVPSATSETNADDEDHTVRMAPAGRDEPADAPADAGDRQHQERSDRVGDAVLDDYLRGFNRYRDGADVQPDSGRDRQLDELLEGWRSLRYRHDAQRAEAGEAHRAKPFDFAGAGTADLAPGRIVKDRFVIEERLGQGGMGVVFKAVDRRKLEVRARVPYVALKVVRDDLRQPRAFQALEREARKAQALAHPNIINVFDFDRDGGIVFLTMELLDGRPLSRVVRDRQGVGMPWRTARPIIAAMARALAHAHAHDVIHADFKPANVFLDDQGKVTVLDFGIARAGIEAAEEARADDSIAEAFAALTPAYASCEMLDDMEPDPRDDIYGLACVTYELLAGQHPFRRRPATAARSSGSRPRPVPGLTRGQMKALEHGLAFDRQARTESAQAFFEELDATAARPRRRWTAAVAGVAVAGLVGAAAYLAVASRPPWLEPVLSRVVPAAGDRPQEHAARPAGRSEPAPSAAGPSPAVLTHYRNLVGTAIGDAVATLDFRSIDSALAEARSRFPGERSVATLEEIVLQARILAVRAAAARDAAPPADRLAEVMRAIRSASPSDYATLEREIAANG